LANRGWKKDGYELTGFYRTKFGSFGGSVDITSVKPQFFIVNPPASVLNGPHHACFRPRGKGQLAPHCELSMRS
jgi:hypothetical protein